jgi:hypothetical protein
MYVATTVFGVYLKERGRHRRSVPAEELLKEQ